MNKSLRFAACLAVLGVVAVSGIRARAALESEKAAGIRSVQLTDSQIEQAALVIGSHVIHINGLTDALYEAAMESANEFNQHRMYYKSELADGAWFEISEAVSIADITSSGSPVNKSEIEALEFTHMTGSDGVTTDLRSGQQVSVFALSDPYDLNAVEELEPLRIQYQILQEKTDKNESDEIYLKMIQGFFEKSIETEQTKECDSALAALENYQGTLLPREKPSMWREKTEGIMTSVDAERRVHSLTILADYLDALENDASGMGKSLRKEENEEGAAAEEEEEEVIPDFIINSEIVSAVGDCIKNVEESISAYKAKQMTDDGETASAKMEYRYCQELIQKAKEYDTPGCDEKMEMLCALQNVLNGVVADQTSELSALTSELVSAAFQEYAKALRLGVGRDYQEAQAAGASQAVLKQYLEKQKAAADAARLEYQTLLDAQLQRMENTQAQQYTLSLIDGAEQLLALILEDEAKPYLAETVEEQLTWLRNEYAQQVKNASDDTEMEKLEKEKEQLFRQRQDALDRNQLAEAKRLTAEMEAKQKEIDDLLKKLNDILNSPNSSEADKAKARAGMGEKSAASQLSKMADTLTSAIRSGDEGSTDLQNQLAALTAAAQLDPKAGRAALLQVQDALDQAVSLSPEDAETMRETVADAAADAEKAQNTSPETQSAEELSARMDAVLEELSGSTFSEAAPETQAAAILAMENYGKEAKNDEALSAAAAFVRKVQQTKNPYLYRRYGQSEEVYISLQTIGNVLFYRYIFDDWHSTVTLQKAKQYYLFTAGSFQCETEGGNKKTLTRAPKLQETLYIHETDSRQIFDLRAEYIKQSEYGVIKTMQAETLAKEIYDRLLEGGA